MDDSMVPLRFHGRYLSLRAAGLVACLVLLTLAAALQLLPPPAAVIALAALLVLAWAGVIRPYYRLERVTRLLLEGYSLSEEEAGTLALSPSTEQLLRQFRDILSPTQLFHMNKRQAQYLALQNQINPHFLYNTLESIRSEALLAGLDDVASMTESLATFFRYTISKVDSLVSVEEEIENCETYFRIQKYRFGDRLELDIRCDPDEREQILRCRLPKLTMQPILENSIIHGTELKVGTGHLTILLELTERRLLIRISDDGLGMDEEALRRLNTKLGRDNLNITKQDQPQTGGLALVNVDNRIRLLFGDEYGLHVFSIAGAGTDVEITLPAINSDREVGNSEVLQ